MIIYKITNKINNKIYIGQDSNNNPNYYGSGIYIKKAIKKYGKNNFIKEILQECKTVDELNKAEIYWIDKLNSTDDKIGYNLTGGGMGQGKMLEQTRKKIIKKRKNQIMLPHSEETKRKISLSNNGKRMSKESRKKMSISKIGIKLSEKHKKNISLGNIGRIVTLETRNKISNSQKGRTFEDIFGIEGAIRQKQKISNTLKGNKLSEETKKKISEKLKDRILSEETKRKISETQKNRTYEEIYGVIGAKKQKEKLSKSHKGRTPWNKGLTKETDERVKKYGECSGKSRKGIFRSNETKIKISKTMKYKNKEV